MTRPSYFRLAVRAYRFTFKRSQPHRVQWHWHVHAIKVILASNLLPGSFGAMRLRTAANSNAGIVTAVRFYLHLVLCLERPGLEPTCSVVTVVHFQLLQLPETVCAGACFVDPVAGPAPARMPCSRIHRDMVVERRPFPLYRKLGTCSGTSCITM